MATQTQQGHKRDIHKAVKNESAGCNHTAATLNSGFLEDCAENHPGNSDHH